MSKSNFKKKKCGGPFPIFLAFGPRLPIYLFLLCVGYISQWEVQEVMTDGVLVSLRHWISFILTLPWRLLCSPAPSLGFPSPYFSRSLIFPTRYRLGYTISAPFPLVDHNSLQLNYCWIFSNLYIINKKISWIFVLLIFVV